MRSEMIIIAIQPCKLKYNLVLVKQFAKLEQSDLLLEELVLLDVWRFVSTECGVLYVMTSSLLLMLRWYVVN